MSRASVLIADDHTLFAEGLRRLVEREFLCLGIVSRGRSVLKLARQLSPDVLLLDVLLPDLNGVEVARRISRTCSATKVLIVSMMNAPGDVHQALAAGASGYLSKECAGSELLLGIREVLEGRTFVNAQSYWESSAPISQSCPSASQLPLLTRRQREVLELVVKGLPAKAIAHQLSISPKTVEFHKTAMIRALALRNSAELIRFAIENNVPGPGRVTGSKLPALPSTVDSGLAPFRDDFARSA